MGQIKNVAKRVLPDPLVEFLVVTLEHKRRHGRFPPLRSPQTFNEKVAYRKLFDRRPLLTQFADKHAVRDFVAGRLGADVLPKLYHVTTNPADIPFSELPNSFVVKPTHGSGWVRIVKEKSLVDRAELINTCKSWLSESFYERGREWPYKNIKPQIIVEEFIADGSGNSPNDYKFFTFYGKVGLIQVDVGRFDDHRRTLYDMNWKPVAARLSFPPVDGGVPKPKHLPEMIRAVEQLCFDIDFVRADFYETESKIYFGELTTTPGSGLEKFDPPSFDAELGRMWAGHVTRANQRDGWG